VTKESGGAYKPLFQQIEGRADVLILCGDLTDYGLPEEAHILAKELSVLKIPMLAVLGNHDYESGQSAKVTEILCEAGVKVLRRRSAVIHGLGFAGAKGFCGGFGRGTLGPWGESSVKLFVKRRSTRRSSSSPRSRGSGTEKRVAILHYAPIRDTVDGEPLEIFPIPRVLPSEEPLERYPVTVVFHGHAHRGALEGKTRASGLPCTTSRCPFSVVSSTRRCPSGSSSSVEWRSHVRGSDIHARAHAERCLISSDIRSTYASSVGNDFAIVRIGVSMSARIRFASIP